MKGERGCLFECLCFLSFLKSGGEPIAALFSTVFCFSFYLFIYLYTFFFLWLHDGD